VSRRKIQRGDAVMYLNPKGEPVPEVGVWLAAEDEAADADGVVRVLLGRIGTTTTRRWPVCDLWVTDTIEERVANTLMEKEEGESR
jgi:hypothetical protein